MRNKGIDSCADRNHCFTNSQFGESILLNALSKEFRNRFGRNADGDGPMGEPRVLAMCGRLPVGKGFFDGNAELVGAAMGRVR